MTNSPTVGSAPLRLSIIIPTYNEVENIGPLIELICKDVDEPDKEIIVVDDNSPDGTALAVEKLMESQGNLRLIVRNQDRGLVPSIKEGIHAADGEVVVWLDADMTMQPVYINQFMEQIDAGFDLVVGSRYVKGGGIKGVNPERNETGWFHVWKNTRDSEDGIREIIISKVGNFTVRHLLDPRYCDYTSGFYAVRMSVFEQVQIKGRYLDYCIRFLWDASQRNLRISEIPVVMLTRTYGKSKTSTGLLTVMGIAFDCFKVILNIKFNRATG